MNIKLTTKNMAYMAMFAAMQIVLEYCTKIYEMPKGGCDYFMWLFDELGI